MQTGCIHCGQQHLLKDDLVARHLKVQFRCTRCGQTTVVEINRRADETMVISPMPSFGSANAATVTADLPPVDDGLRLPPSVDITLTVTSGPDRGLEFTLQSGRTVIGRKGSDFVLNDPEISRYHCLLEVRNMVVNLKDLDSTNGTYMEEGRIRAAVLQEGAEFRLGTSTVQIHFRPK
jgi:DNA segregation ATPase FtsK/SpoIIIE, S-DNA-T family